ncbi:MAG: histone deacetylase family protein [Acidimicrobiia bacterium]
MSLTAIWSEASRSHDPRGEVWVGLPIEGDETPDRATAMRTAIDDLGLPVVEAMPHEDSAITAIHDRGMLDYLRTAHDLWIAAGYDVEPGQSHVMPYAFPHPGAFGHVGERFPRSRAAMAGVYCMDTCTVLGAGSYEGIRYAVDAALTGADLVLGGGGNAYAAVRPPGHHAGTDYFGGSCYLNNAAIAAHHMAIATKARVGILDIDAHHGNGTQQVFYERGDVVYASVHADPGEGWFPHWSGFDDESGLGAGAGLNKNLPLAPGSGDESVVEAVARAAGFIVATEPDLMVVSLGVDSGLADLNSPFEVTNDGFRRMGRIIEELGLPTLLVHEGGYSLPDLARDTAAVLAGLAGVP